MFINHHEDEDEIKRQVRWYFRRMINVTCVTVSQMDLILMVNQPWTGHGLGTGSAGKALWVEYKSARKTDIEHFKSCPIVHDEHVSTFMIYVEISAIPIKSQWHQFFHIFPQWVFVKTLPTAQEISQDIPRFHWLLSECLTSTALMSSFFASRASRALFAPLAAVATTLHWQRSGWWNSKVPKQPWNQNYIDSIGNKTIRNK